jgi:hypothetical protein
MVGQPLRSIGRPAPEREVADTMIIDPAAGLDATTAPLARQRRRRLAVVDDSGRLLGLLCLKKDGTGYCSDDGIGDRAAQRYGAAIGRQ